MRWRLLLLAMLGLMYYGYVRSTTDLAMGRFDHWRTSYLDVIERASEGQVPTGPTQTPPVVANNQ